MEEESSLNQEEERKDGVIQGNTKHETKNVVKTLIMAICKFVTENRDLVHRILEHKGIQEELSKFLQFNSRVRKDVNYLNDLRRVWINKKNQGKYPKYRQCFRIISYIYMRTHGLSHIYNSHRIKNKIAYAKCRKKFLEGMNNPHNLTNLKDY